MGKFVGMRESNNEILGSVIHVEIFD
jgi:hypothetical protein